MEQELEALDAHQSCAFKDQGMIRKLERRW
jgi:hypothetical protein